MHPALIFALALAAGGAIAWWQRARYLDGAAAASGDALGIDQAGAPDETAAAAAPAADPVSFSAGASVRELFYNGDAMSKAFQLPPTAAPYAEKIAQVENAQGLPPGLLGRLLHQESRFRPDIISGRVKSPVGAMGIAQFMPATAKDVGVDPLDAFASIDAAGRYLKKLYTLTGSWADALASYNWGVGNVLRKGLSAAPAETRQYVAEISADVNLPT